MLTQAPRTTLFARLADVVRDVFGCSDDLTRATSSLDVDGWDSLTHTILLLRAESEFQVRLPLERTASIANLGELADLIQTLVPDDVSAGRETARVPRWIILSGNCQLQQVNDLLRPLLQPHGYHTVWIPSFKHPQLENEPEPEQLARCDVFIEQVFGWKAPPIKPDYAANLPAGCRRLRVPALFMKSLWPFNQTDPRNQKTETLPSGKHPYGDSQVIRLMRQHEDPEVVFEQYMNMDIRKIMDLDRLHEMAMAEMAACDELADLSFGPIVEQNFRTVRLFDTINHPSHALLELMRDALYSFILEEEIILPREIPKHQHVQVPIHPQVIDHFKLTWAGPATRYVFRENASPMTFEQWLRAYIAWD